jgi:MarR family 2-MHQ and catechol resistance regulon transcriptional repressor
VTTRYQGARDETLALDTYVKLVRASNTVLGIVARRVAEAGLTPSQFGVLETLLHLGPSSQRALGQKLLISGGNVTMVVGNLERRGLIMRRRRADDARVMEVSLTPKGRRLIKRLFPKVARLVADKLGALGVREQSQLGRLARKLGRALSEPE